MNDLWLSNEPARVPSDGSSNQQDFGTRLFPEWGIWVIWLMAVAVLVVTFALAGMQVREHARTQQSKMGEIR